MKPANLSRRNLLKAGAILTGAQAIPAPQPASAAAKTPALVRDSFWLWGHEAGSHNDHWGLPARSRMTPAEAAFYMSIPNVIMVRYEGKPEPPFGQYALALRPLGQLVWSVVGAGGATESLEREAVLDLASRTPNITGVMMDDFFTGKKEGKTAALEVEELKELQQRLKGGKKKLDLWVVLYAHKLDDPVGGHLKHCDVITFWTWKAAHLAQLESAFKECEKLAPGARKVLGCYMWDYGDKKPMPLSAMERQCELGLGWLRKGRIAGMIFLATCICDLGLETVEWTRDWIGRVGNRKRESS